MSESAKSGGRADCVALTAEIVAAYLGNNAMPVGEISALIREVHAALLRVSGGAGENAADAPQPAVPLKRSVTPEYIVCLQDGKKFKSLKRHAHAI